jgi:hypothetical protein
MPKEKQKLIMTQNAKNNRMENNMKVEKSNEMKSSGISGLFRA